MFFFKKVFAITEKVRYNKPMMNEEQYQIPTWGDIARRVHRKEAINPIERLIYEFEPCEEDEIRDFREVLQETLDFLSNNN